MKRFLLTMTLGMTLAGLSYAAEAPSVLPIDIEQEGTDPADINKTDANGWKQGLWIVFGKDQPEKGYPPEGKIEEGNYVDDKKQGEWIKYHTDGSTPRLIGSYVNGRPNGPYKKFYENGQVQEEGTFQGGKQKDVYKRYYENGQVSQEKTFNADGKEEGVVKLYYPNGQIEFEYTKKDGVTVGPATRYNEDGTVKEKIVYGADGKVSSSEKFEATTTTTVETGSGGPSFSGGTTKDGSKLNPNGYNKVYNSAEELWMDGEFKNGKLWDGKLYKYDKDGILEKIEIWKNGKYHSDGQL